MLFIPEYLHIHSVLSNVISGISNVFPIFIIEKINIDQNLFSLI